MADGVTVDFGQAQAELPGQGFNFQDVTGLFKQASKDLEPNSFIFMDDFGFQEAMSALEIGEPRLDTGLILQTNGQDHPNEKFDPHAPLLPEEVCWILDRALGFEMEFHAGNFLAHTVYTLIYIHRLRDIEPDVFVDTLSSEQQDPLRPTSLVTLVLRVSVQALLKSVDLVWRELAKGGMYDAEDWQSDKSEVSLLEGVPAAFIIKGLESAIAWVADTHQLSDDAKSSLLARLLLRQSLLQIFNTDITRPEETLKLISQARTHLGYLKARPPPLEPIPTTPASIPNLGVPKSNSIIPSTSVSNTYLSSTTPALLSFDPHVGRTLQMSSPIRVVPAPSFEQTCTMVENLLEGLEEAAVLARGGKEGENDGFGALGVWQAMSDVGLWLINKDRTTRVPYARSLCQTSFYDGFKIMSRFSIPWLINQFFYETCGVEWDEIRSVILERWRGDQDHPLLNEGSPPPVLQLERLLSKNLTAHFRALFHNPPRRRRYFMKSLVEWHFFYDILTEIRDGLDLDDIHPSHLLQHLPSIALVWRLSIVREVVLSAFQLELYTDEEKPFAYWYATQVIEEHLRCLDGLVQGAEDGSEIQSEMQFQIKFMSILQALCTALFVSTLPLLSFNWDQIRPNFFRRYKWAFRTAYDDNSQAPVVAQPELWRFIKACGEILRKVEANTDEDSSDASSMSLGVSFPGDCVELARTIAQELVDSEDCGSIGGAWAKDRLLFVKNLLAVCETLHDLPTTISGVDTFDPRMQLQWDVSGFHPWFPKLLPPVEQTS
ncbi:Mak10 subunit, NatC N-terminal acetyltransferase-domain-containing protein [Crepidotus variabilis]|uniref:Mak10 subunit, NatC N-terminal acetyltransferase-domain-containing protein n=1 Tax=Crepidotus variabilis TaxID=179855 RepID=A0A9P6EFW3_9AGAR|nr:Mak10 subunit, NatC N-terminal acetyltransferase-domain-containing protein [Crepidotus variabilis]